MRSGKGLPRRGLPGARERVRSESYPEYEQSHISSTRDCGMVLKLERFSHQSDIYIYMCVCGYGPILLIQFYQMLYKVLIQRSRC